MFVLVSALCWCWCCYQGGSFQSPTPPFVFVCICFSVLDFEQLVLAWPPLCWFQCGIGVVGVFGCVSLDFEQLVLSWW